MHWIYLIHEFHNLSWITEINELFHDILIYWDAPVHFNMAKISKSSWAKNTSGINRTLNGTDQVSWPDYEHHLQACGRRGSPAWGAPSRPPRWCWWFGLWCRGTACKYPEDRQQHRVKDSIFSFTHTQPFLLWEKHVTTGWLSLVQKCIPLCH